MNESLFAMDNNTRKKSMGTNNSPGRTVRLNTALNTALIKKRIKSDTQDKCNTDTQQTQTNTNTMEHNEAEQINENVNAALCVNNLCN